ncbi:hypothetical protein ACFYPZ_37830 [Streptomyces sp. NPDC005506]|uniref:hypothetical protein n=1 Tax=unclassified Streptomyces TaxID=2593676 RepID=UPI0036B371F9
MEEVVLRLKELLFLAIADVAVLSVDMDIEMVRVHAQCTVAPVLLARPEVAHLERHPFGGCSLSE